MNGFVCWLRQKVTMRHCICLSRFSGYFEKKKNL